MPGEVREGVSVRVPGSTSNLGPGFDFLGLALSLYLEVEVLGPSAGAAPEWAEREGEAAGWPATGELVVRALEHAAKALGGPSGVRLRARSEIPLGRGLGSSGAAVAAGLLLGAELAGGAALGTLVDWGTALEGHPDNATASLVGGCTLGVPVAGRVHVVRQEVHREIGVCVAWPATPLATERARAALPPSVPFADAVENPRRLALLLEGLRRADPELLALGGEDRLHARFRVPLVPGAAEALAAARGLGAWLATISGAGSGLVALGPRGAVGAIAEAMRAELERADGPAVGRVVEPVREPPRAVRGAQLPKPRP